MWKYLRSKFGTYFYPMLFYLGYTFIGWYRQYRYLGWRYFSRDWGQWAYRLLEPLPWIQHQLVREKLKLREDLTESFNLTTDVDASTQIPAEGIESTKLVKWVESQVVRENKTWIGGGCSGCVYHGDEQHLAVVNKIANWYSVSNPLHPDIWPSLRRMESEVISMTANLVGGDKINSVCGAMTSGGTESIILAVKAYRDKAIQYRPMIDPLEMEVIIPVTAHAAFFKACDLLHLVARLIDVDPETQQVDPKQVEDILGANTILLIASAPNFHSGVIDPIEELGALASKTHVGLHVDCCLGGFFLPFMKQLDYYVPPFDFTVTGVTSMSVDTHKYGYAPKGSSVVLFRDTSLRHHMYFCYPDWSGGLYCTPTLAGSRPGSNIAGCWASLMHVGHSSYLDITREIIETREWIVTQLTLRVPEVSVLFGAPTMIISFTSYGLNIYQIAELLLAKGWHLNQLQHPNAIHLCLTRLHVQPGIASKFVTDLVETVTDLKSRDSTTSEGRASVYGMSQSLPDGPVVSLLANYLDITLDG
jgi:glutamate/tyrosine decarboxylase-like PLP-dependent enzyme